MRLFVLTVLLSAFGLAAVFAPEAGAQEASRYAFTVRGDHAFSDEGARVLLGGVPGSMTADKEDDAFCLVRIAMGDAGRDPDIAGGFSVAVPGGLRAGVFPVIVQQNRAIKVWRDEVAAPGAYAANLTVDHQYGRDTEDDHFFGTGGFLAVDFPTPGRLRMRFALQLEEYGPYDAVRKPGRLTLEGELEHTLRRSLREAGPDGYFNTYLCGLPPEDEPPCVAVRKRLEEMIKVRRIFNEQAPGAVADGIPSLYEPAGDSYQKRVKDAFVSCLTSPAEAASDRIRAAAAGAAETAETGLDARGVHLGRTASRDMSTDPTSCLLDTGNLMKKVFDDGLPLIVWEASLAHEKVHQQSCCQANGCCGDLQTCTEKTDYVDAMDTVEGLRADEDAAYAASIQMLEAWLEAHCPSWRDDLNTDCE